MPKAKAFADLTRGDRIRILGRVYTVDVIDSHADLVELKSKGATRTITLMPHGREPGRYVLSTFRKNHTVDGYTKVES
jgi:hypothetical protein